ncbi:MAG: hypothetical protein P0Y49_15380 [Candidatus Pedobacter colombiensis]|uniref:Uncharacterized protein n=1 Tax=Candidatus Pedobacter colombiensis TaxID=3121371 RepID=A0AAJ5W562_9SPHI|nr:hypothetical protein [Pedobacter sp.]WEK18172.1 MAG: hypothetical protein P0Y49_15380 [Pedobacter sp.]
MEKFSHLLLGNTDLPTFFAAMIIALIGTVLSLRIKARKRNKLSKHTPFKFSWRFLLQDNLLKLLASLLPVFIALRFSSEFFGQDMTMGFAFLIGLGSDTILSRLEKLQEMARLSISDKQINK